MVCAITDKRRVSVVILNLFQDLSCTCHPDENRDLVFLNEIPYQVRNDRIDAESSSA